PAAAVIEFVVAHKAHLPRPAQQWPIADPGAGWVLGGGAAAGQDQSQHQHGRETRAAGGGAGRSALQRGRQHRRRVYRSRRPSVSSSPPYTRVGRTATGPPHTGSPSGGAPVALSEDQGRLEGEEDVVEIGGTDLGRELADADLGLQVVAVVVHRGAELDLAQLGVG